MSCGCAAAGQAGPDVPAQLRAAVHRLAAAARAGQLTAADLRTAARSWLRSPAGAGDDLDRFCTDISLGAEVDALDPRADAISLLTLHAAKGLEFEVVFLAGCERGLLPLWLPGAPPGTGPDQAEERRLLFVGLSRSRRHLLLSCAAQRSRPGRILYVPLKACGKRRLRSRRRWERSHRRRPRGQERHTAGGRAAGLGPSGRYPAA